MRGPRMFIPRKMTPNGIRGGDIATIFTFAVILLLIYITIPGDQDISQHRPGQPSWLLFTTATSADFQRRLIIRWAWTSLFKKSNIYDHVFAIASTDKTLIPLIQKERELFGDILLIDLEDTEWKANHLKPFEVLKNLTRDGLKGRRYDYISKVDQDSYVDPVRVWDKYLSSEVPENLMLSMPHEAFCGYPSPQGGFYTMSWDLAETIGDLYGNMTDTSDISQEDCQIGRFPYEARKPFKFIPMAGNESFDVMVDTEEDKERYFARDWSDDQNVRGQIQDLKENVVFLHQMKSDAQWMAVMDLFDEKGWKNTKNRIIHE